MTRKTYWVSPTDEGWKVKAEGNQKASGNFSRKDEAVERARELAHAHSNSQVKVQKADGKIQTEWTYGNDPYPPRG